MNTSSQIRLTDELERELSRQAMIAGREVNLGAALKSAAGSIVRGIDSLLAFVGSVNDAMNKARARSANFGSQW
jgi:hypothetical protein